MSQSAEESQWPQHEFDVVQDQAGSRLDVFLATQLSPLSRSHLRRAIEAGRVHVDGKTVKASAVLRAGQHVTVGEIELPREGPEPQNIPLNIVYEDQYMVAVNKPAGMVVHPAKGHWHGTLASALAFHFSELSSIGGPTRPGIVHRLDRETSGVIVVAKSDQVHRALAAQFEARSVNKQYQAIVVGVPDRDRDMIRQPIGIHPHQREKMAIRTEHDSSRSAETFFEVVERFDRFSLVSVHPKTGRTHQIRVHMLHIGCPVLCDRLYGGRSQISQGELLGGRSDPIIVLERLALHAQRLEIDHPVSGQRMILAAELPNDLDAVIRLLRDGP